MKDNTTINDLASKYRRELTNEGLYNIKVINLMAESYVRGCVDLSAIIRPVTTRQINSDNQVPNLMYLFGMMDALCMSRRFSKGMDLKEAFKQARVTSKELHNVWDVVSVHNEIIDDILDYIKDISNDNESFI